MNDYFVIKISLTHYCFNFLDYLFEYLAKALKVCTELKNMLFAKLLKCFDSIGDNSVNTATDRLMTIV